jgi:hypothetical protein
MDSAGSDADDAHGRGGGYTLGGYQAPKSLASVDPASLAEATRLLSAGAEEELATMLSRDAIVRLAMLRTGVEVGKLLPRPKEAFRKDAADTASDLKLRQEQYDEMRVLLLALVLEDRPEAQLALAAQQAEFAATAVEVRRTVAETLEQEKERLMRSRQVTMKLKNLFQREQAHQAALKAAAEAQTAELERRLALREERRKKMLEELAQRAAKKAATIERINAARKEAAAKELEAAKKEMAAKEERRKAVLEAAAAAATGGAESRKIAGEAKTAQRGEAYASKVARVKAHLEEERVRLRAVAVEQEKRIAAQKAAKEAEIKKEKADHFKKDALRRDNAERIRREREYRHADSEARMAKYLAKVRSDRIGGGLEGTRRGAFEGQPQVTQESADHTLTPSFKPVPISLSHIFPSLNADRRDGGGPGCPEARAAGEHEA